MRLVGGAAIIARAVSSLFGGPLPPAIAVASVAIGAGCLLIAGLWTPIAGSIVAVAAIWMAVSQPDEPGAAVLLATIGAALALIGPGAWSIDARLFGWKRIDVRERAR